jgi:hypothetical protein
MAAVVTMAGASKQSILPSKGTVRLQSLGIFFALGSFVWGYVFTVSQFPLDCLILLAFLPVSRT